MGSDDENGNGNGNGGPRWWTARPARVGDGTDWTKFSWEYGEWLNALDSLAKAGRLLERLLPGSGLYRDGHPPGDIFAREGDIGFRFAKEDELLRRLTRVWDEKILPKVKPYLPVPNGDGTPPFA
jgi:hypothetical protein